MGNALDIFRCRGNTIPVNLILTVSGHLTVLLGNATSIVLWILSPSIPPSRVWGVQAAQGRSTAALSPTPTALTHHSPLEHSSSAFPEFCWEGEFSARLLDRPHSCASWAPQLPETWSGARPLPETWRGARPLPDLWTPGTAPLLNRVCSRGAQHSFPRL